MGMQSLVVRHPLVIEITRKLKFVARNPPIIKQPNSLPPRVSFLLTDTFSANGTEMFYFDFMHF